MNILVLSINSGNCRIWLTSAEDCIITAKIWKLLYSNWSCRFGGMWRGVEVKAGGCLCLCLSWDSELPGEFRGCRLWDVSVLHQQLLRDPRPAPHLPHSAAQRRPLRLTGGEKSGAFSPLLTLGRDRRAVCLAFSTIRWAISNLKQADVINIWMCFLFIWIPSVIWEECLLYKEQRSYRTGRGNSLSVSLEQMCMRGLCKSRVCPAWMDTLADVPALTEVPHVSDLAR